MPRGDVRPLALPALVRPTDRVETERPGVSALTSMFNTHPPLADRIAAMEEAGGFRLAEQLPADVPFAAEMGLV